MTMTLLAGLSVTRGVPAGYPTAPMAAPGAVGRPWGGALAKAPVA